MHIEDVLLCVCVSVIATGKTGEYDIVATPITSLGESFNQHKIHGFPVENAISI